MEFKPNPGDVVIVVMGPTRSGKTNFINTFTGNAEKAKARNPGFAVTPYVTSHQDLRLVLVDTPGFNDTNRSDTDTLQLITDWLINKYPDGKTRKLTGILYLSRITDNRMSGPACENLQMFVRLLGNIPFRRVRLVTTMWDAYQDGRGLAMGEKREKELIDGFWSPLVAEGVIVERFENGYESALRIVDDLIETQIAEDEHLIREELTDQQKPLEETEAGKVLYSRVQKLLSDQRETLKELADDARMQNDPNLARSLQEKYDQIDTLLEKTFKEMNIPITKRIILSMFGVGSSIWDKARGWNVLGRSSDIRNQRGDSIIYVVIGPTGSGKTNFIDALSGIPSGGADSLTSGTRVVVQRTVEHEDSRTINFIDTPGFNNVFLKDEQILGLLTERLKTHYRYKIELSIIYLHRITDNRIIVPPPRHINMLRKYCSGIAVRQICVVTTMWDDVGDDKVEAERREELLKEEFRKKSVRALFERFENQHPSHSAWNIMNKLLQGTCQLEQDVEDRERFFNESIARKASYARLQQLSSQRKAVVQRLMGTSGNLAQVQELQAEHESLDDQLKLTFEQMEEKKISLARRTTAPDT